MNPLHILEDLQKTYRLLVETFQDIANDDIRAWMHDRIKQGDFLWRPPFLTLQRRFRFGEPVEQLVQQGLLHGKIPQVFRSKKADPHSAPVHPYLHQTEAWRIILGEKRNCVVTTGTGSGKSFCFALPVVDTCLRANEAAKVTPTGRRTVKALLTYPMNALANPQYDDLAERLRGTGLTIISVRHRIGVREDRPGPEAQGKTKGQPSSPAPAAGTLRAVRARQSSAARVAPRQDPVGGFQNCCASRASSPRYLSRPRLRSSPLAQPSR
jgi:hypothetical protein